VIAIFERTQERDRILPIDLDSLENKPEENLSCVCTGFSSIFLIFERGGRRRERESQRDKRKGGEREAKGEDCSVWSGLVERKEFSASVEHLLRQF